MSPENKKDFKLVRLGQLKDKLLNLNPLYNRKIRFYISERLSWDLTELLNKNEAKLVHEFSSSILSLTTTLETKKDFSLNLETFFHPQNSEDISKFQKKVIHLRKKNLAIRQEKGYNSLFLGVIFLRGYFYNNSKILRLINAPLFLLPCDLERIKNLSLVFYSARKINYNLLYYLQKELGLTKEKTTKFLTELGNDKETYDWESYLAFLTQKLQNWLSASPVKIKLSLLVSSLVGKEENELSKGDNKEPNMSPFVEPKSVASSTNNFEKFFKVGEKNPPINFVGKIIECKSEKFERENRYKETYYYSLLIEHNDSRYINPKRVLVFKNLLRDKSIWQTLISPREYQDKFYVFYCWSSSPTGLKLSFWEKVENNVVGREIDKEIKEVQQDLFQPKPFFKLTLNNKPKNYPTNQLEIVLNFCLTIDSEPNLSLFHDFEKIIEEYSQDKVINWSKSALNLLRGEVESVVSYSESKESNQLPKPLYLPFPSDPSQTRILKVIFRSFPENTLCIDGPPGTGKSQLICNLLANALANQKKVLVICEKEVALKVITDKLASIDLNRSIIKINELTQTPQVYQDLLGYLENNEAERTKTYNYQNVHQQIINLEQRQTANLKKIADYCQVENDFFTRYHLSLPEVYLKFSRKYNLSSSLIQLNGWVKNKEQLDKLKTDLENYISKFNKIFARWKPVCLSLKKMFLERGYEELKFNWENQNNFQEITNNLLKELKGEPTEINLLIQIWKTNLLVENSQTHQSINRLESKIKYLEELKNKPNYQRFFAFLQLESFEDFWQKCGNKEFLVVIQQFISEEFLTIGELHLSLNSYNEDTQNSINYFLKKVLVDQESNYLDSYHQACEQAVYFNWIKAVEEENKEILAYWNQDELDRIHQEQKKINQKKSDLVRTILKNEQTENLNRLLINQGLRKELSKKRGIAPLKKLFPELVNYFPLWLTTPEVIASITDLQTVPFDFLVFDEASQVPLEKSIPLWARAKKCLVIGDEQQLPPTDFFKSHLEIEEEIWEEQEEENKLLNEAEKNINLESDDLEKNNNLLSYAKKYSRSREKLTLLYHYRSKYPELIEFSNQAFYNGVLQIVSASDLRKKEDALPIEFHYQDKGRWINNENEVEARYIANLLRTLPKSKEVGIITFNVKQRDLLIDLIGEGNNVGNQKDSKWKNLTDSLRGSQEVHSRFDEFITKIYWLFREKKGKPQGTITEIDFQGFKGFRADKELRGKRKYRVYGRCDAKFSRKKNQPETETGKISILINQLYLLDKLGMDKVVSSYSEAESWREQEFTDINFDKLINTIAHELAHAYQFTIHIRKSDGATKSECESSGKKNRNGNFLYPDKVAEHTQLTAEIEKMTIALPEYQEFKIWWTSKSPSGEEESCRDEKNIDSENKSLSERKNCEYCGKIKSYNCCERSFQEQSKSNNLFIKNLEEVQGDERDIIIFSIGYARNEEGKFYLRFGPLGQEGGEKRLNVAISRAREKIIIVTSILPSDLRRITDEDENRNLGSKLFKKYLEYAYYCGKNLPEEAQEILKKLPGIANASLYEKDAGQKDFDSPFEEQVHNELINQIKNFEIHKQVKSIGYHIDLAVWDNQVQQYILGIECDGYYWHSQLKDIERDIYRQQLLEKKGWKIIRLLSRDWCRDKEKEIERVKKALSQLV